VVSNAGGALPLLAEKLDLARRRPAGPGAPPRAAGSPLSTDELLRRLYVDTATPSRLALTGALSTFGADRMLFGTDSPPLTAPLADALARVAELPLSSAEIGQVLAGNAQALFGLAPSTSSEVELAR
jgi:predicted TIM-barrel fold metal-dependent hydrolase